MALLAPGRLCSGLALVTGLLLLSSSVPRAHCQPGGNTKELHFLALLPFEIPGDTVQPSYHDGPIILPAAQLAVQEINSREDLLAGYTVNLTVANSACNLQGETLINFVREVFNSGPSFVGVVGPACSDAAELVGAIASQSGVALPTFHITSSPRLSNRKQFGYTYGTVSSSLGYVKLFTSLIKANQWRSVAIFYEESKIFYSSAYSLFIKRLRNAFPERQVVFSSPISEIYLPLSSIMEHRVRIVFILATSDLMQRIFCRISRNFPHLMFPTYQFVLMEVRNYYFFSPATFSYNGQQYYCSVREVTAVMEGALLTHVQLELSDNSTVLVSGLTYGQYLEQYRDILAGNVDVNDTTEWANPFYDGVWSLALALNGSAAALQLTGNTLNSREVTVVIQDEVLKLDFQGASGRISFENSTGFVAGMIELDQVSGNSSVPIGHFAVELYLTEDGDFIGSEFESVELVVHPALATFFLLLTAVAVTLIVTAHILTLVYHDFKSIKASSYRLSQLIFIGCYLLTISILALTVEKVSPSSSVNIAVLCGLQAWCLPTSLTLILGSVGLKTWRLYCIFIHLKKPRKLLSDWSLIVMVLILVSVDVVLCLSWTVGNPFTIERRESLRGVNEIDITVECDSESYFLWFGVLTAYQGLFMFIALALALLTKGIRHESFKTKSIVVLVYFLTIVLLLGFPVYFILRLTDTSSPDTEYPILAATLNTVLYLCFFFLFFPPVLSMLREKVFHKIPILKKHSTNTASYETPAALTLSTLF